MQWNNDEKYVRRHTEVKFVTILLDEFNSPFPLLSQMLYISLWVIHACVPSHCSHLSTTVLEWWRMLPLRRWSLQHLWVWLWGWLCGNVLWLQELWVCCHGELQHEDVGFIDTSDALSCVPLQVKDAVWTEGHAATITATARVPLVTPGSFVR